MCFFLRPLRLCGSVLDPTGFTASCLLLTVLRFLAAHGSPLTVFQRRVTPPKVSEIRELPVRPVLRPSPQARRAPPGADQRERGKVEIPLPPRRKVFRPKRPLRARGGTNDRSGLSILRWRAVA